METDNEDAPNGGMTERIRACARIAGSGDELARVTGINRRTLESYLSGQREPKASTVWRIAVAVDVSADWLIGGKGPMRPGEAPPSPPPAAAPIAPAAMVNSLEDDVFGDLFDAIATLYEQRGVRISRRDLAALASEKANEIAASQADPALRRAMIPLIITQLDKELRAGKGKTDTGKRSA